MTNKFKKLGLHDSMVKVIIDEGFTDPTEIQHKSIPHVISGKDVIGGAQTGSGKTLAFAAGIIEKTQRGKGLQALVLTPTRELAQQVADSIKNFTKYEKLRVVAVYGGVAIGPQIEKLQRSEIVVGTPGRMLDHLQRRTLDTKKINMIVLDEADRMLEMGFIEDVERILRQCPKNRQTLLYSATITPRLENLSYKFMNKPVNVNLQSEVDPNKLKQFYIYADNGTKISVLSSYLKNNGENSGLTMIFCNTRRFTDIVAKSLKRNGLKGVRAIHGGYTQHQRSKTLDAFNHNERIKILVCTDVAARGLDINGITTVINFDLPDNRKDYIHRIGRTARAGESGKAISIVQNDKKMEFSQMFQSFSDSLTRLPTPKVSGRSRQRSNNHRKPSRAGKEYYKPRVNKSASRFGF
jgi:ATP-dependent RNA helicase DeaD